MAQNNRINFQLDFKKGDTSALDSLKKDIQEIQRLAGDLDFTGGLAPKEIQGMVNAARTLETALDKAYDVDLNTINIKKFNQILKQSGYNAETLQADLASAGITGQQAFLKMTSQLMQFNTVTKQTNHFLDNIATTFFNTLKWGAMSSILNNISGTIQKSYYYVKDLDTGLNDIRIVTGKSADEMERFAEKANDAAKALAVTTEDYTKGSLIYYQQGLNDETVKTLTDITAKTSNVTGQGMDIVSEQLTAVWNGYKVANQAAEEGMQVYEEYVDKMAAVGATTASDLEELSTAMSKVASAASAMGVSFDDLNAQIATIVSVTRQAPESVGTALKTIYARLGDLKVDGVDEFGVKLGEVTSQLQTMGINILDQQGNMRQMSTVITEVAAKWDTWTSAQRQAAAVAMAGKRQYNNLIALFDNWDMYGEALETSLNAAGTLEKQQEIAMDSLANKMDILEATAEDLYDSLFDTDTIKGFVETGTDVLQFFADFTDAVGGLNNILPMLGSLGLQVFNEQIGRGLSTIVINARNATEQAQIMKNNFEQIKLAFSDSSIFGVAETENEQIAMSNAVKELQSYYEKMYQYQSLMTKEQKDQYNAILNAKREAGELEVKVAGQLNSWKNINESFKLFNGALINDKETMASLRKEIDKINIAASEIENHFNANSKNYPWKDMKNDINGIHADFKKFISQLDLSDDQISSLVKKFKELKPTTTTAAKDIQQLVKEMRDLGQRAIEVDNDRAAIDRLNTSTKQLDLSLTKVLETTKGITNITKTIGALGQFAMGFSTLTNVSDILKNNNLTELEKVLQVTMNLSFALPQLGNAFSVAVNSIGKFTDALKLSDQVENISILTNKKKELSEKASELSKQKLIALEEVRRTQEAAAIKEAEVKEILDRKGLVLETQREELAKVKYARTAAQNNLDAIENEIKITNIALEEADTAAIIANNSAETRAILVSEGNAIAKIKEIIQIKLHKKAVDEETKALVAQKAAALSTVGAIAGIIAVVAIVTTAYKKYHENLQNIAQAEIERTQKIQEEIDTNRALYESYQDALKGYEEGTRSKEEMINATQSICDAYDLEIDRLAILNNNYKDITKSINEARLAEIEESRANLKIMKENQATDWLEEAKKDWGRETGGTYTLSFNTLNATNVFDEIHDFALRDLAERNLGNRNLISSSISGEYSIDAHDIEAMKELYEGLVATRDDYIKYSNEHFGEEEAAKVRAASADYQSLNDKINQLAPKMEAIQETDKKLKEQNILAELYSAEAVESLEDYYNLIRKIANTYGYEVDEVEKVAKEVNFITNGYEREAEVLDAISKKIMRPVEELQNWWINLPEEDKQLILQGKVDFTHAFTKEAVEKEIEFARNKLQTFDVTKLTSISGSLASGNKLNKDDNEILDELNSSNAEAMAGFDNKSVLHQLDVIDEITQRRIESNQEYLENTKKVIQEEINLREQEKKQYEELLKDREESLDTYGDDYTEEEKAEIQEKIDAYKAEIEALDYLIEDLKEAEKTGLSWEEAETLGFQDLIAKIDMVANKAESLQTAAELIGEGFTVAASDVEKFASTFPELLENMEVLSDGSLQLSKETVQENIAGIKKELEARTQAQIAEVDQQIELKKLDIEFTKKRLENIQEYLKGESTGEKLRADLAQTTYDYQEELRNLTGEDIEKLANFSIKSSVEEADNVTKAINAIGSAWSQVSQAHAAAINGEAFEWQDISFNGTATTVDQYAASLGSKASQAYAKNQEEYEAAFNAAKELQSQYNTLNGELDELNAKRVVLESTSNAAISALDRVAAGKAGKESKSSSKDQKDKDKKEFEDEFNRYFDIEKAIEAVDYAVKILEKDQKNLHGKELIDSLKKENELIQEQTENYQKLYDLQVKEAKEVGGKLKGLGVEFDASGAITNYAEATTAALAEYNKAVDAYNAGILDDAGFEIAEKAYENFKKQLERYEALYYSEMRDTLDKIDDNNREVLENNLKSWETEIQIQLDMNELERDWKKFFKEINNDFKKVYKDLRKESKAIAEEAASYKSDVGIDLGAVNDIMAEIDKLQAGEQSKRYQSVSQAQEDLKKFNDQLIDHASTLHNLVEQAWDTYLKGIDQASDKFDDLNDKFERVNDNLEFQGELIELMYGEKAYGLMKELYAGQEYSARNQIQSVQQQLDFWTKLYNETEEGDEDHLKAQEKMNEMQDKLNDLTIDYIKLLKDDYANSIDEILDTLDKKLTGGKGSEWLSEEWERVTEFSDTYFDNLEKGYHIQTLANKVEKDISKTYKDNLKAQQKLSKYQDQVIAKLKQEKNLRQEDLDIAQAKYDLLLKEIALEDARNNKTTMKLTRNEQGNWSYQYVADEEETENARQDKLDSNYNLYETASGAYNQVINEQLSAASDFTSKMKDLQMDESISQEEKNTRLGELRDQFLKESEIRQEKAQSYLDEIKIAGTALGIELYQQDQDAFTNLINNELQYFENFINTEKTDYLSLEQAFNTNCDNMNNISKELMEATRDDWSFTASMLEELWNGDEESVRVSVNEAYESITEATNAYEDKIVELEELIGKKFHGPEGEECIVESIRKAERETDKLKEKTNELVVESGEMLTDLRKDLDNTTQEWNDMSVAIQNAINKLAAYMQMQGKSYTIPTPNINIDGLATNTGNVASSASKGKDYKKTAPPVINNNLTPADEDEIVTAKVTYREGYGTMRGEEYTIKKSEIARLLEEGAHGIYYDEKGNTTEFDTGGYTGEWNGDNGRLALLHQKELVLNENDTKNLLDTVKLSRGIMDFVRQSVSNMFNSSMLRTSYNISGGTSPVQTDTGSTFYINSLEFPNANSVEEIKTAIMSLPNVASQYVNRNVK